MFREMQRSAILWRLRAWSGTLALLTTLALLLGCGASHAKEPYGGSQNHVHDLLALRGAPHTVLMATHFGLYRTVDGGHNWAIVAGGAGQQMDGLMIYKLVESNIDSHRVYVLAIPRSAQSTDAKGVAGVYTSGDSGQTWRLASPTTALPTRSLFTLSAGSDSAEQILTLLPSLGRNGLYASDDSGAHWRKLPSLPDVQVSGVVGDPHHSGRMWAWSTSTGLYLSEDSARSWRAAEGIGGGVSSISFAGAAVYASGDAGMYVSSDEGSRFTLANADIAFSRVFACAAQSARAYALGGTAVYSTSDGGRSWQQTAQGRKAATIVAVDPSDANIAYLAYSYPIGVHATVDGGTSWRSVLP
jgi:photosystem II stability/assembly factor-like uncharacterized protein